MSGLVLGFHGDGSWVGECIFGDRLPASLLADEGFFEQAGTVVLEDTRLGIVVVFSSACSSSKNSTLKTNSAVFT